ncbi:CLUMA_CG004690, isoform A [Clunio marinus]|uniref:CLUMA_CG004690, isoform A n=1 Tax=Clunio marinus TaxID=568069 RepID=A0A1J1HTW7_9DIPT|nr:CLUMA_CG004690, isoform A [Clunio marinus]
MTSVNPCVIPTQPEDIEGDNRWLSIHKRFLQECREKDPEILFVGDDILLDLSFTEVYRSFEEMHLLNFSIRGDKTQNILWRLQDGELQNINPKIIVLHCGTNNSPHNSAEEIAEGIAECVLQIRNRLEESFIVVPSLLPRGHHPNKLREINEKVNELMKEKLQSMKKVQIVDISKGLVQLDGTISHHDLHDYLNLTNAASKKLFEPIWDLLNQILNENEKEVLLTPTE